MKETKRINKLQEKGIMGELISHLEVSCSFVVRGSDGSEVISFNKKGIHLTEEDFNDMIEEVKAILYNTQQRELAELNKSKAFN